MKKGEGLGSDIVYGILDMGLDGRIRIKIRIRIKMKIKFGDWLWVIGEKNEN